MFNRFTGGQVVERLMRQRQGTSLQLSKDGRAAPAVEPGRDGVGAFGRDQCPIELEQLGSDAAVLVAEQFSQPLLHGAASAAVCSQMTSGLAASWAGAPESGLVSRAFSAEGFIKGCRPALGGPGRRRRIGPIVAGKRYTTVDRS